MGVKYVKDFAFPFSGGFHGDVQRYAKGGHVTKVPAKAKASAKDMPARAKPNAPAKGAPKMMSKPKVGKGQGYADGGSIQKEESVKSSVEYIKKGIEKGLKPGTPAFSKYIANMPIFPSFKSKSEPYMPESAASYLRPKKSFKSSDDEEDLPSVMKRETTGYNEGGRVPGREMDRLPTKKPPGRGKDLAPSKPFKGKYEGYADGGEIGIAEDPTYEERMEEMRRRGGGIPDMTREGMGETRGGPGEIIGTVSPLDRAAAVRRRAMMPNADLMRRAGEAVRQRQMLARSGMINPRMRRPIEMYAKGGAVKGEKKIGKVMGEYKRGELHSGSKKGPVVKNPKQAIAIALSEARKAGAKIPKKAEGGPLSYAESGSKAPKERSFKEAFRDAREVAKREGRDPNKEIFTWKGEKYKADLEKKFSPEKKETSEKSSRKMSSEEFVKEYEKAPASGRMKQEAYYKARPEPSLKAVDEDILGPKSKAALAGAGAAAAGYGLKKARDFLMRRGQKARSEAADVMKGSGAMSRSAAAREAEAAAYAERLKNARRSPGMTGYEKGGEVMSKGPSTRYTPLKGRREARERAQQKLAEQRMRHAEKYAPGMSLDMKAKGGLSKHEDVKMDKQLIRSAVHKHESAMHPGKAKTKLRHGGMPSYGRKPMYGGGKC